MFVLSAKKWLRSQCWWFSFIVSFQKTFIGIYLVSSTQKNFSPPRKKEKKTNADLYKFLVNTRRYLDVNSTFFERNGRQMSVKTTLCSYWVISFNLEKKPETQTKTHFETRKYTNWIHDETKKIKTCVFSYLFE